MWIFASEATSQNNVVCKLVDYRNGLVHAGARLSRRLFRVEKWLRFAG